ncbi:hypothetical protein MAQA_09886 [Listeria aquatica FSL S10-1188]|uniref:Lipoprotein n=1 Tax=Listeria aquatica FSL S10-1188 TaxID=1265818 RepID=W7AXT2_9LIST|nr:hypothetical protein MAQA_09886 [Listeria aquatica FSL S10-1188]
MKKIGLIASLMFMLVILVACGGYTQSKNIESKKNEVMGNYTY